MAALAHALSSFGCPFSETASSHAQASFPSSSLSARRLHDRIGQVCRSPLNCRSIRAAKNVPPAKGRARNTRKALAQGAQRIVKGRDADMEGWTEVAAVDADFVEGKNKAIIHNKKGYVLVKREEKLHAIQANCTSCNFPIIEGKVSPQNDGLAIRCPLCHTSFSLEDGRVLQHCPKDGPFQWVIGTLKEKATPEAAKILRARVSKSGRVYMRFVNVQVI